MEIGIMGLASSGKTTLFHLLTGQGSLSTPQRRETAQVGMARVPDSRLDALSALYEPKKTTPATVRYVDVPGIPEEHRGESTFNIPELRSVDALMVVLRAFPNEAVPHPIGSVNPYRDLQYIEEEFILQDQMIVERRLERVQRDIARLKAPNLLREAEVLERCLEVLESGQPLREEDYSSDEEKILRGFTFLSLKPLLIVLNHGEEELGADSFSDDEYSEWIDRPGLAFTRVCATLEGELAELGDEDATSFMQELGIADRALDRVIHESYRLLGLLSFFTVGDDECRAWSIREGTPAVEAAGEIHSDIQRGFIRAEVVPCDELLESGSLSACRQKGTLRLEGKTYPVQDGEVVHFRFNV